MYEIIEDYKSCENKNEIFDSLCRMIWQSGNERKVFTKTIHYTVRKDLINTEIGKIFDCWSDVEYKGYKAMSSENDWCSLIRQKINNLYTRYFDKDVILNKDYMYLLNTPKRLYYRWLDGDEVYDDELTVIIDNAIDKAIKLKPVYQKQKMVLSWDEYKNLIETFLLKIIKRCKLINEYEKDRGRVHLYDFMNEDSLYIRYFCKSLEGEMLKYQKEYYGVRDHKKYKRCKDCGSIIENTGNKKMYCDNCAQTRKKLSNKTSDTRYRNRIRENRNS